MPKLSRRFAAHLALHVVVVGVGVLIALALIRPAGTSAAYAANHCTRYGTYSPPDTNCNNNNQLSNFEYVAPSYALRDSNHIYMTGSRSWYLMYDDNTGPRITGIGYEGHLWQNSQGIYRQAWCGYFGAVTFGHCVTYWHD